MCCFLLENLTTIVIPSLIFMIKYPLLMFNAIILYFYRNPVKLDIIKSQRDDR